MSIPAPPPIPFAIVEHISAKYILNIYDAIELDRLRWEAIKYDPQRHCHLDRAYAYLPIVRCKLICHQVLSGQARGQLGWQVEVFGGGYIDGQLTSRTFKLAFDPGDQGRFTTLPWRITISMGPGAKTKTGGITPVSGGPQTRVGLRLSDDDLQGICLEVQDFLRAHQRAVEQVRRTDQLERYHSRQKVAQDGANGAQART